MFFASKQATKAGLHHECDPTPFIHGVGNLDVSAPDDASARP